MNQALFGLLEQGSGLNQDPYEDIITYG